MRTRRMITMGLLCGVVVAFTHQLGGQPPGSTDPGVVQPGDRVLFGGVLLTKEQYSKIDSRLINELSLKRVKGAELIKVVVILTENGGETLLKDRKKTGKTVDFIGKSKVIDYSSIGYIEANIDSRGIAKLLTNGISEQ